MDCPFLEREQRTALAGGAAEQQIGAGADNLAAGTGSNAALHLPKGRRGLAK